MTLVRIIRHTVGITVAAAALAATALPSGAAAQSVTPPPAFSVSAGAFEYDLSGVGTAPMVALRADFPLGRVVLVEGGVAFARPEQSFGGRSTMMIPEAQLQVQLPLGRVMPYIGAGGGAALDFQPSSVGGLESSVTASLAGGLRAWLSSRAGLRAELRVRGIGTGFEGAAAEWTAGFTWRL